MSGTSGSPKRSQKGSLVRRGPEAGAAEAQPWMEGWLDWPIPRNRLFSVLKRLCHHLLSSQAEAPGEGFTAL